ERTLPRMTPPRTGVAPRQRTQGEYDTGGVRDGGKQMAKPVQAMPMAAIVAVTALVSTIAVAQDRTMQQRVGQERLSEQRAAQDRPVMVDDRVVSAVQGVWRSRGYGYMVKLGAEGPKLFHVAGGFCYADPRDESDPESLFVYYRPLERGAVAFSGAPG